MVCCTQHPMEGVGCTLFVYRGVAMKKHKALIPLDGSTFSRQILPHVRRTLGPDEYELILFRVAPPPEVMGSVPPQPVIVDGLLMQTQVYASERDAELARHPIYASQVWDSFQTALEEELWPDARMLREAGYKVSTVAHFGDPAPEIVALAEKEAIDLVAMATHGRSGLGRLVLGSVAEYVLRHLSIPILLIRPSED